jgi:hypothetical protein
MQNIILFLNKDGLAIEEMRHWSQKPLQSPIQNVKNEAFWRHVWGPFKFFVWMVGEAFLSQLVSVFECGSYILKNYSSKTL